MIRFLAFCDRHAAWIVVLALAMAAALWLAGCDDQSPPPRISAPPPAIERVDPAVKQLADLRAKLASAEHARDQAAADGHALDRLSAEKDILATRTQIAEAQASGLLRDADELRRQGKAKDGEIAAERTHEQQVWLYWFSGIVGLVAVIAVGVGCGWPLLRSVAWTIAAVAGSIAAVALVAAAILPWLWWIGGALVAGFVGWVLYHWHRDHHGLVQVVTAVEGLKPAEAQARQAFKDELSRVIDSPIAKRIGAIKKRYGIGQKA